MSESRSVTSWIQQQTVLVTGGNGFLGQALVFKLLKCGCPRIYLLLRAKKGHSVEERLENLINGEAMISYENKDDLRKRIVAIPFDLNANNELGLSLEDLTSLREEVTVVFHLAASIRFDDSLKAAMRTNVKMTKDLLDISKGMKQLQIFVYTSTAFANVEALEKGVEEKLYEKKMNWRALMEAVGTIPDEILNGLEKKLLGVCPNTYIFTKHLTESVVAEYSNELPLVIVRPPIVTSSTQEPQTGWFPNLNSAIALPLATFRGVIRVIFGTDTIMRAYTPVDIVSNITLVTACYSAAEKRRKEVVPVYNMNYFEVNSKMLEGNLKQLLEEVPVKPLWHPFTMSVSNRHGFLLLHLLLHFLPGLLLDGLLKLMGRKSRLTRIYRTMYATFYCLYPFQRTHAKFYHEKSDNLMNAVSEKEKEIFYFTVKWPECFYEELRKGCEYSRIVFKEPRKPVDSVFINRLYYLHQTTKACLLALLLWIFPYSIIMSVLECVWNYSTEILDTTELHKLRY